MSKNKTSVINNSRNNKVVLYTDKRGNVELRADVEKDTLWATLNQIADIFHVQKAAISKHIKNIFNSGELEVSSTVSKMETVQKEGGRVINRQIDFYNLDVIIAVGYRVNSKMATQFRIWSTRILHSYLVEGYALNQRRIATTTEKFDNLHEAIDFIESKSQGGPLQAKVTVRLTKDLMR